MPTRILRDYTDSYRVAQLSAHAERLYVRIFQKADDFGRFFADAPLLRAQCLPVHTDVRDADIPRWLAECEKAGLLVVYTFRARKYLAVVEFKQRNRLRASKFPAPEGMPANWEPAFDGQDDGHMTARDVVGGGGAVEGADGGAKIQPPPPSAEVAAAPEAISGVRTPRTPGKPSAPSGGAPRGESGDSAPIQSGKRGRVRGSAPSSYRPDTNPLPIKLDTAEFRAAWVEWCSHRAENKKRLTPTMVKRQLLALAEMGQPRAIAAIHHSIAHGWQGIFEPKGEAGQRSAGGGGEARVTDSFVGSDGQWNDVHTEEELKAIFDQPDIPPFPFANTPRTPEEAERRRLAESQGGEDAGQ